MGKSLMETTSLIDTNDSSDSIVEVTSHDEDVEFIRDESSVNDGTKLAANVTVAINDNKIDHKLGETSDVPPLANASDSEETRSQTSMSSSIYTIKETSEETKERRSVLNKSPQNNDTDNQSKPWDENSAQIAATNRGQKNPADVFHGISVDSISSINTVQTSNKDGVYTSSSAEFEQRSPQQETKRDGDQQHSPNARSNRDPIDSTLNDSYGESVLEKYLTYVTEFFSCYTSSTKETGLAHRCANMCNEKSKTADNSELESQLQVLQTCIESDIITLMGCSAEGAQSWIDSIGDSLLCQCSGENSGDRMTPYPHSGIVRNNEKPKIRNRNVYLRQKAHDRIRRLRQSGLSRDFSLSPIYDFKGEEHQIDSNPFLVDTSSSRLNKQPIQRKSEDKKNFASIIPLSQRPRGISDETRQTSLNAESAASYESVVLATRSDEMSTCEEDHGNNDRKMQTCIRPSIFSGFFTKSDRNGNAQSPSEDTSSDLYYDSDPGTRHRNVDASELRKTIVIDHSSRSRTLGAVSDITSDLRRLESDSLATKMSLIQSLDVDSFDVNDSQATSQLISELITSNFSFIWHTKEAIQNLSGSSNATPHRIKSWFEMGSCLKKTLLQPKFVWRSNDNVLFPSRQSKMKSIHKPESVELLNIVRIVAPTEIDRQKHPFVKKDCAFYIITNTEEEFLFETATKDERTKFLFVFKLMVARLASKIIVGDKDVFDEFFTPLGAAKREKKRRKQKIRRNKFKSDAIRMSGLKQSSQSDSFSVSSEATGFSKVFIGTVEEESQRKGELWGSASVQ